MIAAALPGWSSKHLLVVGYHQTQKSDRWQRQSLLQASTPTPSSTTRKTKPWKLELRTKAMRRRLANCKWASRRMRNGEDLISCCIWKRWKVPTWTSGSYIERCLWASVDNVCQIVNLTWTSHGHNSCKCLSIFWCLFGPLLLHIFCLLYVLCCMFGEGAPGRFLIKNLKWNLNLWFKKLVLKWIYYILI